MNESRLNVRSLEVHLDNGSFSDLVKTEATTPFCVCDSEATENSFASSRVDDNGQDVDCELD